MTGRRAFRSATSDSSRRPRIPAIIAGILGVAAVVAAGAVAWGLFAPGPSHHHDLAGNTVALDADAQPSAAQVSRMQITRTGDRFVVPSVGLDVSMSAMNAVDGSMTPPGFTDAYRMRNVGVNPSEASTGTVYVVMHSVRNGGRGPGNALIDISRGTAAVAPGARVQVGDRTYAVTGAESVVKAALPSRTDLWASRPGRLVIITCLQTPSHEASAKNVVITAELAS